MALIEIGGVFRTREEWCEQYGVTSSGVTRRMQRKGMTLVEAITYQKPKSQGAAKKEEFESRAIPDLAMAQIPEFPDYYATEDGRIWSARFRRFLTGYVVNDDDPYERCSPADTTRYVHRLVCQAWHGEPEVGYDVVDHIDRDTRNNHRDNLRWTDAKGNADNRKDTVYTTHNGEQVRVQDLLVGLGFEKYSRDYMRHFNRIKSGISLEKSLEMG